MNIPIKTTPWPSQEFANNATLLDHLVYQPLQGIIFRNKFIVKPFKA